MHRQKLVQVFMATHSILTVYSLIEDPYVQRMNKVFVIETLFLFPFKEKIYLS